MRPETWGNGGRVTKDIRHRKGHPRLAEPRRPMDYGGTTGPEIRVKVWDAQRLAGLLLTLSGHTYEVTLH